MTSSVRRQAVLIVAAVVMTAATIAVLAPGQALAHATLIGREDLPLPEWLLLFGSLVILVVSFAGLVLAWRKPHFEDRPARAALPRLSGLLLNPFTATLAGLVGVALTVLVVWTGLDGVVAPDRNFSVSFVFVTFWLGLTAISVIFGDVFRAFNPWRAIGRAVSAGFSLVAGQRAPAPLAYPERLGRWPAAIAVLGFLFLELVWGQSGFAAAGISPRDVAIATLVYSAYTFAAMALFGVDRWIDRGEAFSQYFGDVRQPRAARLRGRPNHAAPAALGRDHLVRAGRIAGPGVGRDRRDHLRRRPGGGPQGFDQLALRDARRPRRVTRRLRCGSPTPSSC